MKKRMLFEGIIVFLLIVLCLILYVMVTSQSNNWSFNGNASISGIGLGDDGSLYAFTADTVYAINSNGSAKWSYRAPDGWCVYNHFVRLYNGYDSAISQQSFNANIFASDNGTMYLYERHNLTLYKNFMIDEIPWNIWHYFPLDEQLVAISSGGHVLWQAPLGSTSYPYSDVSVYARNGRVYVFNDYNLTVFDTNGTVLFRLEGISDPPAIDDHGFIYAISAASDNSQNYAMAFDIYTVPSSMVRAYYPNGSLYWHRDILVSAWRPAFKSTLPIYENSTLYVPTENGIWALDMDGRYRWSQSFGEGYTSLFSALPMDAHGHVYLLFNDPSALQSEWHFNIISADGRNVTPAALPAGAWYENAYGDPYNGNVYYAGDVTRKAGGTIDDLYSVKLVAYNVEQGSQTWNYTLKPPVYDRHSFTIDVDTVKILSSYTAMGARQNNQANGPSPVQPDSISGEWDMQALVGKNTVYVSFESAAFEDPIVYNESKCVYYSGIYAFDKNGSLLWSKPTSSFASSMEAGNGTIYYATRGGQLSMTQFGLAGIAALAVAYLFVRFIVIGAVARARSRIDKNENRNSVLEFIVRHPGLTMSEISRDMHMNIGTVRYHLFILRMNHRIAENKADGKSVRYFTNSGSYGKDEQSLVSLLRREPVRKLIGLLLENPGLSNGELAKGLGMGESAVCRYTKELLDKGVIARSPEGFSVSDGARERIAAAVERIGDG
jgi:predicted transcriptional regulator